MSEPDPHGISGNSKLRDTKPGEPKGRAPEHPSWVRKLDRAFCDQISQLRLPSGPLVLAVSGGPDSMALAHLMLRHSNSPIILAHFDHQLRGQESTEDALFVVNWAKDQEKEHGVMLGMETGLPDSPLKDQKGNLESNARKARYRWLIQIAKLRGAQCLLTAHHADDQAETILFRLLRGTGVRGLVGITPKRVLAPGIQLARPLLPFSKTQILRYLDYFAIPSRLDSTNLSADFTRNRIRQKVIPILREVIGDNCVNHLAGFSWHARNLDKAMGRSFARWKRLYLKHASAKEIVVELRAFRGRSAYWLAHFLSELWKEENWPCLGMTRAHWLSLANQGRNGPERLTLPGGIVSQRISRRSALHLYREIPLS